MSDIQDKLDELRDTLNTPVDKKGMEIPAELNLLNDILLTFFEYLVKIEEEGRVENDS